MRTERFRGTLLSALIIVPLIVPAITLLPFGPTSALLDPESEALI